MKWIKRIVLGLLALVVVAVFGASWYFSGLVITPNGRTDEMQMARIEENWGQPVSLYTDRLSEPEEFRFETFDGLSLFGRYYEHPEGNDCGAVITHGWGATGFSMVKVAWIYYERGCDVVLYDHRSIGRSEGTYGSFGVYEREDVLSAVAWLEERAGLETSQIGLVGESYGAAAVLQAAPNEPGLAFVVADSSYQDLYTAIAERAIRDFGDGITVLLVPSLTMAGMRNDFDYREASPLLAAPNIEVPVMLVRSQADEDTSSDQSQNIFDALTTDEAVFHHLDWGSIHGRDSLTRPDEYAALVHAFIDEYASGFGETP